MTGLESDPQQMPDLEPLLSIDEVCDLLRISESGVYRFIRRGELARVKVGGRTLFEPEAIREFIAERRRASCDGSVSRGEEAA